MALTETEKKIVRLLIQRKGAEASYMEAVGQSDEFAREEISKSLGALLAERNNLVTILSQQKSDIETKLALVQEEIELLQS